MPITRRNLLRTAAVAPLAPLPALAGPATPHPAWRARWIWYPEHRTISATFVLFRKTFDLAAKPDGRVEAWVSGHSRYQLWINGRFVQRGPAPCDPRYWDVDPVDIAPYLQAGHNVIAGVVCAYGAGDGTYVPPSPLGTGQGKGFLFQCDALNLATDGTWLALRPRCWRHGAYQRWFLRAFQEEFDARHYPRGWSEASYNDSAWRKVSVNRNPPGRPALSEVARSGWRDDWVLQPRTIPALVESLALPKAVSDAGWINWKVDPEEYFECFPDDAFEEIRDNALKPAAAVLPVELPSTGVRSAAITFDFGRELVGHPRVKLRAPAGTVVEILMCEKQVPGKLLLRIPPGFGQWVRVTCGEGVTEYEAFEYDCFRQMQLCVRNSTGPVEILEAGVKERNYDWPHQPDLQCSDPEVQRAFDASVRTQRIVSQETLVDNCVRERQQYAGDLDLAKLGSYYGWGETRQPARMLRTFAQGQNAEGWFMDSWPAWDRCQRLFQKHMDLTGWGTIIDHAMQFGIAIAEHQLWDKDDALLNSLLPRMQRFADFLERNAKADGLLPVLDWTWNTIWIDHIGYQAEIDKHCALNIYWAGYLSHGLAKMYEFAGQPAKARALRARSARILERVRSIYWSPEDELFIDNLPRRAKDGETRLHARTLSMALLFGALPRASEPRLIEVLEAFKTDKNPSIVAIDGGKTKVGFNYPLNDLWRLWALARLGRGQTVINELKERWSRVPSVFESGTYAEMWDPRPSVNSDVWCQANPGPIIALYQLILGVQPTAPGFAAYDLRPQPGNLIAISGTVHTVRGPIRVAIENGELRWTSPAGVRATLVHNDGTRKAMPVSDKEQSWTIRL